MYLASICELIQRQMFHVIFRNLLNMTWLKKSKETTLYIHIQFCILFTVKEFTECSPDLKVWKTGIYNVHIQVSVRCRIWHGWYSHEGGGSPVPWDWQWCSYRCPTPSPAPPGPPVSVCEPRGSWSPPGLSWTEGSPHTQRWWLSYLHLYTQKEKYIKH